MKCDLSQCDHGDAILFVTNFITEKRHDLRPSYLEIGDQLTWKMVNLIVNLRHPPSSASKCFKCMNLNEDFKGLLK